MSDLEFFPDHLQTIKEDPKDHEESKYQSPSRAQSKWLLKNSSPTTLNPDKQSSFPPGYIKETEENQSPEGRQERDSPAGKPRGNTELERMLQIEREKLTAIFQQEMQQKLEELDTKLNGYWEKKYHEIQQSYESKIHQYEELLTASQNDSQADVVANLEKEISEKYQQQYLEKIEEIQQNFKDIEEENLVQIIEEIKKDMENQYEERFSEQVSRMRQEATDEIERHKAELNSRRGTTHEPDEFQKMLQVDVKSSIENALREKYEQEKQAIVKKYTQEQDALKKEIHTMETKMREKLEVEVEEELKKEFVRKEKLMDLNWRKKMESYKKNLEQNFEQEMKTKLENEKKEIEKAKVEISRMKSLENVRLKKAEENKKSIESKLKEQEDKYEKVINNLKKQIEELKNSSLADEERLSHVGKRENSKDARSNSLARSGHQQAKSLMDSKIMTELHNKNKQDSFLEEGFYKPDTSNAHSPLYEHTRNKSPMSPPRREVFEDRSADKFFPPKPTYNQPISNLRSRADRQSMDEPYRVVQDIIDPMAPPDLLSLEKSDHMENFSRERELPKEENKLSVITQQQASTYDILKAQIMKKYSPQKSGEFTGYDAPGETQRFDSSATSARGALVENQEEAQVERESVPLNYSMYQRERDTEKSEEDNFQKKYEAILRKYNKENFGKEKYQNSTSERGSFRKEVPTKDSNQTGQKKYQSLFEIKSDDDQKTKDMKKLKKTITDMLEKDQALESKYLGREIYFTTDFLTKIDIETTGQQKTLKNSLKILYDLWNDIETSYQARLNFLDSLELIPEYENLMKKINLEIDYLKVTQRNVGDIMGLLKKRNYYREQINFDNFDYKKFKKLYFAIDSNNMDLRKLIEPYKRKYNKDVLYKGIEANDIIKLDAWENEYLQKVELKQEILEKIRKKI